MDFTLWDQCGIYSSSKHNHEKKQKVWQYKTTGKQILKVCNNFLQHLTHFYNEIGNEIKQEEQGYGERGNF